MATKYYKVKDDYFKNHGERYFCYNDTQDSVTQILFSSGIKKKGRNSAIGMYTISRTTFLCNYLIPKWCLVEEISQELFMYKMHKMFAHLAISAIYKSF